MAARRTFGECPQTQRPCRVAAAPPDAGEMTRNRPLALLVVLIAAVLAGAVTFSMAVAGGWRTQAVTVGPACTVPHLAGSVVDVTLIDMGGRGGMMQGRRPGPMMGGPGTQGGYAPGTQGGYGPSGHGMMRVLASRGTVPAGTVSLRVVNSGTRTHELVVLPLAAGQWPGDRPAGLGGRVSEAGSLGEASASCAPGAGKGIAPGTAGWVTLTLRPGRYELVCNLPGHYPQGMYAELDVR
jgi:uncharacterized cupredoxin-like copper-binding protein